MAARYIKSRAKTPLKRVVLLNQAIHTTNQILPEKSKNLSNKSISTSQNRARPIQNALIHNPQYP
jgi:RNase adaptor protein for sRNA GlmZ degradation